ncbi:MAG: hypothetical protein FJZ57_01885 [Chlamydiae bacterium]|nr:hypothetical protein [Chlamydiota bacterium]
MKITLKIICFFSFITASIYCQDPLQKIVRPLEPGVYNFYMTGQSTDRHPNGLIEEGIRIVKNNDIGQIWETKGIKIYKDSNSQERCEYVTYDHRIFRDMSGNTQCITVGAAGNFSVGKITVSGDGNFVTETDSLSDLYGQNIKAKWVYTKIQNGYSVKALYQNPKDNKWLEARTMKLVKQPSS